MTVPWHKIFIRTQTEAIVSYELSQVGPIFWDRSLVIQVWRKNEYNLWQIYRQYIEQEGRSAPTPEQADERFFVIERENIVFALQKHIRESFNYQNNIQFENSEVNSNCIDDQNDQYSRLSDNKRDESYNIDIRHIEMRTVTEGLVVYHLNTFNRKNELLKNDKKIQLWTKVNDHWKLHKCL